MQKKLQISLIAILSFVLNAQTTEKLEMVIEQTEGPDIRVEIDDIERITFEHLTITVVSPNGGEDWEIGSSYSIEWASTNIDENVTIALYASGSYYSTISSSAPNNGSFTWMIPNTVAEGESYTISISNLAGDVQDFSDNDFIIFSTPQDIWTTSFANGMGNSVQQTTDGGYIIAGSSMDYYNDALLIKTDSQGEEVWIQTFDGDLYDYARSVQQTSDGGYIVTGTKYLGLGGYYEDDNFQVWLLKTDSNGNETWNHTFGVDSSLTDGVMTYSAGYSVQQTSDGGYIITGYTNAAIVENYGYADTVATSDYNLLLIKTDSNGNETWFKLFGGTTENEGDQEGRSVQQTTDGGYIIAGISGSYYDTGIWLLKTDSNGNETWNQTINGLFQEFGSVQQTSDGGYIITGTSANNNTLLLKTDSNGNETWNQTFGGDFSEGHSGQQTTDGGYVITGYVGGYNTADVLLIKADSNGNEIWNQIFGGGNADDRGNSVQQTSDGGYIITGDTGSDIWLIKTDPEGNTAP
jgi:hypothetical protein